MRHIARNIVVTIALLRILRKNLREKVRRSELMQKLWHTRRVRNDELPKVRFGGRSGIRGPRGTHGRLACDTRSNGDHTPTSDRISRTRRFSPIRFRACSAASGLPNTNDKFPTHGLSHRAWHTGSPGFFPRTNCSRRTRVWDDAPATMDRDSKQHGDRCFVDLRSGVVSFCLWHFHCDRRWMALGGNRLNKYSLRFFL